MERQVHAVMVAWAPDRGDSSGHPPCSSGPDLVSETSSEHKSRHLELVSSMRASSTHSTPPIHTHTLGFWQACRKLRPVDIVVLLLLLLLAGGLSAGVYVVLELEAQSNLETHFGRKTAVVAQRIQSNFTSAMQEVGGLSGTLALRRDTAMTAPEFEDFTMRSRQPLGKGTETAGVGVVRRVMANDRLAVEASLSAQAGSTVVFVSPETRQVVPYTYSEYQILTWGTSTGAGVIHSSLGLEFGNGFFSQQLQSAIAQDSLVFMNRLDDPMGNNVDPYTLIMFQPSYSTGRAPDTAAQRIAANNGGTLAVFHMSLFVRSESCSGDADLCCLLFDSQANSGSSLLTKNSILGEVSDSSAFSAYRSMRSSTKLEMGSKEIELVCRPTSVFFSSGESHAPITSSMICLGCILILALMWFLYIVKQAKYRDMESQQREGSEDLKPGLLSD